MVKKGISKKICGESKKIDKKYLAETTKKVYNKYRRSMYVDLCGIEIGWKLFRGPLIQPRSAQMVFIILSPIKFLKWREFV